MRKYVYPARFLRDRRDGGYIVKFRDIPEAITQGESVENAIEESAGALQAALEGRILSGIDIPAPTSALRGEHMIAVPIQTALKVALYLEMQRQGMSKSELARRLRINEKEARRMLDPHHPSKADRLEKALSVLGRQAELRVA